jgi:hypothetical protein
MFGGGGACICRVLLRGADFSGADQFELDVHFPVVAKNIKIFRSSSQMARPKDSESELTNLN